MKNDIYFLDDETLRTIIFLRAYPDAKTAETADQMIELLANAEQPIKYIFLDHDLDHDGYDEKQIKGTGMEVVEWLEQHKPQVYKIIVHSRNGYAGPKMAQRLANAGFNVWLMPFFDIKLPLE